MLYEGAEKKLEVYVAAADNFRVNLGTTTGFDLRKFQFWPEVVAGADAKILSRKSNSFLDAYLLSESSLFVWGGRWLMITCGQTQMVGALKVFLEHCQDGKITSVIFERKNEYFPNHQPSDFYDDCRILRKWWPQGQAFRFGEADGHHIFLFIFKAEKSQLAVRDKYPSLEVLAYGLSPSVLKILSQRDKTKIQNLLHIDKLFPGFDCDDYLFDPPGYSVNGLEGENYFAVHITPQAEGSYLSFESNVLHQRERVIHHIVKILKPLSFDVVEFNSQSLSQFEGSHYQLKSLVKEELGSGDRIQHMHFFRPEVRVQRAFPITTLDVSGLTDQSHDGGP